MVEDLRAFISKLEKNIKIKRVSAQVDWERKISHVSTVKERKGSTGF